MSFLVEVLSESYEIDTRLAAIFLVLGTSIPEAMPLLVKRTLSTVLFDQNG